MSADAVLPLLESIGHIEEGEDGADAAFAVSEDTCLEALKDLQRVLRRDDPERGPARLVLAASNAVRRVLAPLVVRCQDDASVVLAALRVLVMLTMPVQQERAAAQQLESQLRALREHKAALLRNDVVSVLVALLAEPLQRLQVGGEGEERTADDVARVELVLALLRNLLLVPDSPGVSPADTTSGMHDALLRVFFEEQVLDLLLVLVQVCEEHRHWSVVLLDIVYLLFRRESPEALWADAPQISFPASEAAAAEPSQSLRMDGGDEEDGGAPGFIDTAALVAAATAKTMTASEAAREMLRKEQRRAADLRASRHGRFFRPVVLKELGSEYILHKAPETDGPIVESLAPRGRRRKSGATVISKHRVSHIKGAASTPARSAPASKVILKQFGVQFLDTGFSVLYAVVSDFLKASPRDVLPSDALNRLWLVYFFVGLQMEREEEAMRSDPEHHTLDVAPIACTLDIANIVGTLTSIEEYDSTSTSPSKSAVATGVLALGQILRALRAMIEQSRDASTRSIGVRIALRLFHDPSLLLNRVPFLISRYNPKTRPVKELEALVEVGDTLIAIVRMLSQTGTAVFVQSRRGMNRAKKRSRPEKEDSNEVDAGSAPAPAPTPTEEASTADPSVQTTTNPPDEGSATLEAAPPPSAEDEQASAVVLPQIPQEAEEELEESDDEDNEAGDQATEVMESQLEYSGHLSQYCTNAVVGNYALLFARLDALPRQTLSAITRTLQRLVGDLPGSVAFFWQLPIFRVLERVLAQIRMRQIAQNEDVLALRDVIVQIVHEFFESAKTDPSLFVKVFCWRTRGTNRAIASGRTREEREAAELAMEVEAGNYGEYEEEEDGGDAAARVEDGREDAQLESAEREIGIAAPAIPDESVLDPIALEPKRAAEDPPSPASEKPKKKRRRLRKARSPSPPASPSASVEIAPEPTLLGDPAVASLELVPQPTIAAESTLVPAAAEDSLDAMFNEGRSESLPAASDIPVPTAAAVEPAKNPVAEEDEEQRTTAGASEQIDEAGWY